MRKEYGLIAILIMVAFLITALATVAKAAEAGPSYVGVFGGYVIPQDLETPSGDIKMKNSWMLGAKFGYIIPTYKWVAAELEYNHLFKQDVDQAGDNGDFSADSVMANFLVRCPEGMFHPYVGFGIGWSWGDFKSDGNDNTSNNFAWQILAGLNYEITKNWSADLGYRYFQSKYSPDSGDVTSKNHIVLIGVNYHF